MFRRRIPASHKQVLEAIIVLLDKKGIIRKDEIQLQILENAGDDGIIRIKMGEIEYKFDKEDKEDE